MNGFLLTQTLPDVKNIGEMLGQLDIDKALILIIILLILFLFGVVFYLVSILNLQKQEHKDDASAIKNSNELTKTIIEQSAEDRNAFREAIKSFQESLSIVKEDREKTKRDIELHDSASARRAENIVTHFDERIDKIYKKLEIENNE